MRNIAAITVLSMFLAAPALAQSAPSNNGVSQLNAQGTIDAAPCYGCNTPQPPSDCVPNDSRQACAGPGPYDERPYGSAHPGANGLNWQPKNGHEGGA